MGPGGAKQRGVRGGTRYHCEKRRLEQERSKGPPNISGLPEMSETVHANASRPAPLSSHGASSDTASRIRAHVDSGAIDDAVALARSALANATGEDRAVLLHELAIACTSGGRYIDALRAAAALPDLWHASERGDLFRGIRTRP